ncbi:hypothetical protein [Streptomyces atratus]|uniref:hypothetical protein n=1 Tax=Streptomyces atratus TaxID=1893 RepID=UPI00378F17FD
MSPEPQRRRPASKRAPRRPELPLDDEIQAWSKPVHPVEDLDSVARRYPRRKLSLSSERKSMEFYDTPERPKAFSMDSLEFFFLIAQYFREALPLRLILLMIACQKAGGQIRLTQEEMATVLWPPSRTYPTGAWAGEQVNAPEAVGTALSAVKSTHRASAAPRVIRPSVRPGMTRSDIPTG